MKIVTTLWLCAIPLLACHQNHQQQISPREPFDTATPLQRLREVPERAPGNQLIETANEDSLNNRQVLDQALATVKQLKLDKRHQVAYTAILSDNLTVDVTIDRLSFFNKKDPHVMIRRKTPGLIFIDIFSDSNGTLKHLLAYERGAMEYMSDTIRDINGDGLLDFAVNWYGSSGCCLKAFSDIFLQRSNNKDFSKQIEFINPTFSPKEHVVRGVCYGHPGHTEMYKFKWRGEAVDTIEYVSLERNQEGTETGKIIISRNRPWTDKPRVLKKLFKVPDEYLAIEGFDWFMGRFDTQ